LRQECICPAIFERSRPACPPPLPTSTPRRSPPVRCTRRWRSACASKSSGGSSNPAVGSTSRGWPTNTASAAHRCARRWKCWPSRAWSPW